MPAALMDLFVHEAQAEQAAWVYKLAERTPILPPEGSVFAHKAARCEIRERRRQRLALRDTRGIGDHGEDIVARARAQYLKSASRYS